MEYPISYYNYKVIAILRYACSRIYSRIAPNMQPLVIKSNPNFYRDMLIAINDTCEFLQVNLIEFIRYLDEHSSWSDELWEKLNANADVYNRSIIGDYGKRNICANTISSFSLKYTSDTLYTVLGLVSNYNNNILLCDYGCCNANITISMLLNGKTSYLAMHDYHTESTNLIEYRLNKHKMQANAQWHDINDTADKFLYDVVYCTDVLEHTTTPLGSI